MSEAVPAVLATLKDESAMIRSTAVKALREIDIDPEIAVPALTEALKDENKAVRSVAVEALEKIKTAEAVHALEEYRQRSNKF